MNSTGQFEGATTHQTDFDRKDGERATAFRPVDGQNTGSLS